MSHNILFFHPSKQFEITKRHSFGGEKIHYPGYETQKIRVPRIFRELQNSIDNQNIHSQLEIRGLDPEFVVVFEVAGSIDNFNKAAKKAGLEWLCTEENKFDPDDEFYPLNEEGDRINKPVDQKIYITMSNRQALQNLLSLWNEYNNSPTHQLKRGFSPFVHIFEQLRNLRKWSIEDRLDHNVISQWEINLNKNPLYIRFEIELWYRENEEKRSQALHYISEKIKLSQGKILKIVHYPEIKYHALIVELPSDNVRKMINDKEDLLSNSEEVMLFRCTGQTISFNDSTETIDINEIKSDYPQNPPVIALLDGLPLSNHVLLEGRLSIFDPDNFENEYPANSRNHGTAMSSLIIYGDKNSPKLSPIKSRLYVRPIMKGELLEGHNSVEKIPSDEILADIIHRAVLDIINNEESKNVRIINLSIGCKDRPFLFSMSPEARMLDYLSEKYNLLFIVSAGNIERVLELEVSAKEYEHFSLEERAQVEYKDLWDNQSNNRILSPSESINSLCIGSLHDDNTNLSESFMLKNPLPLGYPSLYSRFGGGFNRSNKPDAVLSGGQQYYNQKNFGDSPMNLEAAIPRRTGGPGQLVASPENLNATKYTIGTSNSTALATRICGQLLENLKNLIPIHPEFEAIATKCMFIHSCSWTSLGLTLKNNYVPKNNGKARENVSRWIGYGIPEIEKSLFNEDYRVTLMGYGSISSDKYVEFKYPLPTCLQSQAIKKRLTITLAWNSPIDVNYKKYRLASLEFKPNSKEIRLMPENRIEASNIVSKRGTVQHEIYEGESASTFNEGEYLTIQVQCKKEDRLKIPVKYVLMVTLEVSPNSGLPLFGEIENRLQNQIQVR